MTASLLVFVKFYVCLTLILLVRGIPDSTLKCIENALIESSTDCYYPRVTSSQAIRQLRDKWVVFMGESTLRQLFLQFLGVIKSEPFDHIPDQKGQRQIEERLAGSRYTFFYYEYYQNITEILRDGPPKLYDGRRPDLLILNDGLHDLLYDHKNMNKSWDALQNTIIQFTKHYNVQIMWIPSPQMHDDHLTKHRKDSDWFNNDTLYKQCVAKQKKLYSNPNGFHYYYDIFRNISYNTWNFDGIHNMERARMEAEGLIRTFYYLNQDPSAWKHDQLTAGQIMTFLFYIIITIVVVVSQFMKSMFYRKKITIPSQETERSSLIEEQTDSPLHIKDGTLTHRKTSPSGSNDVEIVTAHTEGKALGSKEEEHEYEWILPTICNVSFIASMLQHYIEYQAVYHAFFRFAVCLILLYLCDGPEHLFVSPSLKRYNRDFFIFLHLIFLAISYLTFTKNTGKDHDKILSRLQSEEWKGIMQIVFVMYHYFDAAEVYNLIRIFIGAYVWMTGFGNTIFFVKRNVFNLNRLFGMLFRLNWLVFWVCVLLNQQLMLYYICPLHTFFFMVCYTTWGIAHHLNDKPWIKEIKLVVSGLLLCLLFETDVSVFNMFWSPLSFVLNLHGTLYEWHFRTMLDHYATWLGMVFAVYYDRIQKMLTVDLKDQKRVKVMISTVCVLCIVLWYAFVYRHDKYTYNELHPYTEAIPIFAYIMLRNIFDGIRPYYSSFLAWMGQITLESYIFQYHLYMINDAKSILTVIPNYPLCNFVIVSIFYIWISRVAFDATNTLRNFFYPPRSKEANLVVLKTTISYVLVLVVLYVISCVILLALE